MPPLPSHTTNSGARSCASSFFFPVHLAFPVPCSKKKPKFLALTRHTHHTPPFPIGTPLGGQKAEPEARKCPAPNPESPLAETVWRGPVPESGSRARARTYLSQAPRWFTGEGERVLDIAMESNGGKPMLSAALAASTLSICRDASLSSLVRGVEEEEGGEAA